MEEFVLENRKWELSGFSQPRNWYLEKVCTIALLLFLAAAALLAGRKVTLRYRLLANPEAAATGFSYEAQPRRMTMEQSMALGKEIGAAVGAQYDMISYTDACTCLMDSDLAGGVHLLTISNVWGSFQYRTGKVPEVEWSCGTRAEILSELKPFMLYIPENAVFVCEGDGWHSFFVEGCATETYFLKGTVRCRYAEDGTVKQVESSLLSYPRVGQETESESY